MRRLIPVALALTAASLHAQSVWDSGVRLGPQLLSYQMNTPVNQTITEFVVPMFVVVPMSEHFSFDVGSSYTAVHVSTTSGPNSGSSDINGLTDTQIRGNLSFGNDFVVLTGGVNLPTGRGTVNPSEQLAAGRIASDFLAFPITTMGTGFGFTGGLAIAQPLGDWNVGFGGSVRRSEAYDPYTDQNGAKLHYQPGDEYRARFGLDHPVGTGRFAVGLTYSKFGNDVAGGSVYNTGDRWVSQAALTNSVGSADFTISAWDLYRASGTLANGSPLGFDNVLNGLVALGFHPGGVLVEPNIEVRNWQRGGGYLPSTLGTVGLRMDFYAGGFGITPSAGYTVGRIAAPSTTGAGFDYADMTGFRAVLAIRLGGF